MWVQAVTDTDDHDLAIQVMAARSESTIVGLSLVECKHLVNAINLAVKFNRFIGVGDLEMVQLLRVKLNEAIEVF